MENWFRVRVKKRSACSYQTQAHCCQYFLPWERRNPRACRYVQPGIETQTPVCETEKTFSHWISNMLTDCKVKVSFPWTNFFMGHWVASTICCHLIAFYICLVFIHRCVHDLWSWDVPFFFRHAHFEPFTSPNGEWWCRTAAGNTKSWCHSQPYLQWRFLALINLSLIYSKRLPDAFNIWTMSSSQASHFSLVMFI